MRIDVIPSVNEARTEDFLHRTTIVIDVLRATSTICTALAHGCASVIPVETVFQAKELKKNGELLGGERFCKKITGFDLGNSPFEYMNPDIEGKTIIMTTTNGTRAIQKAQKSDRVLAGSLLNAPECARIASRFKRGISILCAGTQDQFSLEDGLCAGFIVDELTRLSSGDNAPQLNDFAIAMRSAYLENQNDMEQALLGCANGKKFIKMGLIEDVQFCAKMGATTVVPELNGAILQSVQIEQ